MLSLDTMKGQTIKFYYSNKAMFMLDPEGLKIGEKLVFLLIMGLLEKKDSLTLYEVIQANKPTNTNTSNRIFRQLKAKGYFTTQRSNQFFSRAYITPTEKAFLLLRSFRSLVASLG
jgi:hypothetical protein